jgi:3-oxoacyl-[acyl-carrier protein] reductase
MSTKNKIFKDVKAGKIKIPLKCICKSKKIKPAKKIEPTKFTFLMDEYAIKHFATSGQELTPYKQRTALITGGSHGIGLAIKKELERNHIKVIDWSRSTGHDLMKKIPKIPKDIDFLINNVGGMGTCKPDEYSICMKKNYGIMEKITTQYVNQFLNRDINYKGKVITISSIFGKETGLNPGFVAAKAAQIAYMKSMSNKFWSINFNTVCPGYINVGKKISNDIDNNFIGCPIDIAKLVSFLISDDADFINGACITVDGGLSKSF